MLAEQIRANAYGNAQGNGYGNTYGNAYGVEDRMAGRFHASRQAPHTRDGARP